MAWFEWFDLSRRGLLRKMGIGRGGVALAGSGPARASTSRADRREAAKKGHAAAREAATPVAPITATAMTRDVHAAALARQGITAVQMDAHDEAGLKLKAIPPGGGERRVPAQQPF